jgi:hypothetical protein
MKAQQGKFVVFFDELEFAEGLASTSFSRVIQLRQCHHTYIPNYGNFQQTNHFSRSLASQRRDAFSSFGAASQAPAKNTQMSVSAMSPVVRESVSVETENRARTS